MAAMRILCMLLDPEKKLKSRAYQKWKLRLSYMLRTHMKILCGNIICLKYDVGLSYTPVACVSTTETCGNIDCTLNMCVTIIMRRYIFICRYTPQIPFIVEHACGVHISKRVTLIMLLLMLKFYWRKYKL